MDEDFMHKILFFRLVGPHRIILGTIKAPHDG